MFLIVWVTFSCSVVWIVSILFRISCSLRFFSRLLRIFPRAPVTIRITVPFQVPQSFQFFDKIHLFVEFFAFFHCYSMVCYTGKVHKVVNSSLFVNKSGILHDAFVSQSHREFFDRFWFVHIPFIANVKFQSHAQFSIDYPPHSVLPTSVFVLG